MSTNITQLTQASKDFTAKFISILADPLFKKGICTQETIKQKAMLNTCKLSN